MKSISNKTLSLTIFLIAFLFLCSFNYLGEIKGWFLAGSKVENYDIGIITDSKSRGKVAYLKSIKPTKSNRFGTVMQTFNASMYRGKKVKLTGYLKTKSVNGSVGMWMRVDGKRGKVLSFDNMNDRRIKGTSAWEKYDIILNVPDKSQTINYGVLLCGEGTVLLDDLTFEEVKNIEETGKSNYNEKPTNSSFEN